MLKYLYHKIMVWRLKREIAKLRQTLAGLDLHGLDKYTNEELLKWLKESSK